VIFLSQLNSNSKLSTEIGEICIPGKCIEINPCFCKGYCWKAYAIANLIKRKMIPAEMESVGLASACIAASLKVIFLSQLNSNSKLSTEIGEICIPGPVSMCTPVSRPIICTLFAVNGP
jgi:hypothetical protein